jgi:hypothetical protein
VDGADPEYRRERLRFLRFDAVMAPAVDPQPPPREPLRDPRPAITRNQSAVPAPCYI